jgi:hypothetical protein
VEITPQQQLAAAVTALLQKDPSVRSVWLVGSLGSPTAMVDQWSDTDLAVVVHDDALADWYGYAGWLSPIGRAWATERSGGPLRKVIRVVFYDGRRLDLVFFGHSLERPDLPGTEIWRRPEGPGLADHALLASRRERRAADGIDELVNRFRFVAALAVVKLARTDDLVGLHLALECVRSCLVLGMLMRDAGMDAALWADLPARLAGVNIPSDTGSALFALEEWAAIFEARLHTADIGKTLETAPLEQMISKLRAQMGLKGTEGARN